MERVGNLEPVHLALARLLFTDPGQSAGLLTVTLRRSGWPDITKQQVNSTLYSKSDWFTSREENPPVWSLTAKRARAAERPTATVTSSRVAKFASVARHGPALRAWQDEALAAWGSHGRRGVVEAVTGAGKSLLGVQAACDAVNEGRSTLILVPGLELLRQWQGLLRQSLPGARVGALGGGATDSLRRADVLVATVQSAASPARVNRLLPPTANGLLIADECHRYGAETFSKALDEGFDHRLGLTATYGRDDLGNELHLDPYFGGVCYSLRYARAIRDGVVARFRVATLGVDFSPSEQSAFELFDGDARETRGKLIRVCGVTPEPFGEFMRQVSQLAEGGTGDRAATSLARRYLNAFSKRRQVLASTHAKKEALAELSTLIGGAERAIVFTETIESAEEAAGRLADEGVRASAYTSALEPAERTAMLDRFRMGQIRVLAAPRVLDEGIDVPEADLGVILAASRSQRQMIQRMGRVIRPKNGGLARFVIFYVRGTVEDPARGAHETFIGEMCEVADGVRDFGPGMSGQLIKWFGTGPKASGKSVKRPQATSLGGSSRVGTLREVAMAFDIDVHGPLSKKAEHSAWSHIAATRVSCMECEGTLHVFARGDSPTKPTVMVCERCGIARDLSGFDQAKRNALRPFIRLATHPLVAAPSTPKAKAKPKPKAKKKSQREVSTASPLPYGSRRPTFRISSRSW